MREVRPDKVHLHAAPGGFEDLAPDHLLNDTNLVTESKLIDRRHRVGARVAHSPLKISAFLLVILLLARGTQANNFVGSLTRVNTSTRPHLDGVVEEAVTLVHQAPNTRRLLTAPTHTAPSTVSGDPSASYFVAVTKDQTLLTGIQLVNAMTGVSMASTFNNLRDVYTVIGFGGYIIRASFSEAKVRVTETTTTGSNTVFSAIEKEYSPTDTSTKFRCGRRKTGTAIVYFGTTDKIIAFNVAATSSFAASLGTSPAFSAPVLSIDFMYDGADQLVATSFDQYIHVVASADLTSPKRIKNFEAIPYLNLLSNTEATMFYTICGDRTKICKTELSTTADATELDATNVVMNLSSVPTGLGNFGPFHYLIVTEPTQISIYAKQAGTTSATSVLSFGTMARTLSPTAFFSVTADSTIGSAYRNMFVTFSVIYNDSGINRVDLYKQQVGLCKTWATGNSNHCLTCWANAYTDASITNTALARPCVLKENIPVGKGVVASTTTFDSCTATTADGRCTDCRNDHTVCSSCSYSLSFTATNRQFYCAYKGTSGTDPITKCLGMTEMGNPGVAAYGSRLNGPDGSNVCTACSVNNCASCFKSNTQCFQCITGFWRQVSSGTHSCFAEASIPAGWGKITPAETGADPSDLRDLAACGTNVANCASNHKIATLCSSTDTNLYLDLDKLDMATAIVPTDTKNTQCYATDPRPTSPIGLISGGTGNEMPKAQLSLRKCAHIKSGETTQRCANGGCSALNTQCTTCNSGYYKTAISGTTANNCYSETESKTMGLYLNVDTLATCTDGNCLNCWADKDDCALCNNTAADISDKYFRFAALTSPFKHTCLKAHQPGYRKESSTNLWEACEAGLNCYKCDANKNTCSACDPATTTTAYRWLGPFSAANPTKMKCYQDADPPVTGYGKRTSDTTHATCTTSGCTNCGPDNAVCIACVAGSYMYTTPAVDIPGSPATTCQVLAGLPNFGLNVASNSTPSLRTLSRCSTFCSSCEQDHLICTACSSTYLLYKLTPASNPTCQAPGDILDGKGVNSTTQLLVDCRDLATGNVKQCRANYLVYETCNEGFTRNEVSTTNLCQPYVTYKDQKKGHNPATHLATTCSQSTCMDCHADYRVCKLCDQANNYYKDTEDTQNNCVSWNTFAATFGANLTNNLKTKCSEANCQLCKENYTMCTSCDPQTMMVSRLLQTASSDYFLNNVANPPICRMKTQFANGWGVDPMASPKAYRSCEAANCMSCVDDYRVCDKCNTGYYRNMKTTGNRCFLPADFPTMTGINEAENIYQACSPITNCVGCLENYQICSKCGTGFYKNNLMLGNLCITKSQFLAHHGADESANLMKKCFHAGCDLCVDKYDVCTSCFNTHTFASKAPYCTLISETKATGDEAEPVQYVCNSQVCAAHTPSLRDLRVKFKTKITEAMKKKFRAHYKVFMNDGRECTGCGKMPYAVEFNGDADEFVGKIGFTRRFSCNKIILTTSIDEGIPENSSAPVRLLQTLEPNAKDQFSQTIELDYNHGSNFAEVLSFIIKILNFIFMAAFHIIFPMSSYYINQCLSWVGHLRVLSGPLLRSNTVPIYYLSSNWIFPFFVSNPYWNRAEESACEPQMNYSENGYQCNIFANFGQNFNIMLAAFTFNFIIFTITQGYNRVTAEQHKGGSGFGLRIRKHLGLRYFYQFFDAYNLEIMGIALINISNVTEKKENIVGFILSCLVFLYYVIFYSCAFKFVWSVSTEIAENEKLGDRKITFENWDQVKSAYDADLVFLIERYKIPQGNTWRLWIPVVWWLKNAIIQSLAVILAEEGNGQLIPILFVEFTFWLVVWIACAKKSIWDSFYDIIFGLSHVIYLIAKCASTVNDASIDTIQGQISYCCATAILIVVCACIVHSFLIAIEYILEMFKKPAPAKAVEAKPEEKYKEDPVVVQKVEPAPVKPQPQPVQVQKPVVVMGSLD